MIYIFNYYIIVGNIFDGILGLISIMCMICVVAFQIFKGEIDYKIILIEIFIVYLTSMLIYQIGYYGLRGDDSYFDYDFFKHILNSGHFNINDQAGTSSVTGWPILHVYSSILAALANITPPIYIAKYFPSFLSSFIVFPLYLLSYSIYSNKKLALLSCLIFGTVPKFISFESLFVRESIALLVLIFGFYLLYRSKEDKRFILIFLCIIPTIILSHHFTSFLFAILIVIYLLTSYLIPCFKEKIGFKYLSGKINLNNLFLLFSVSLLSYWIYSATFIWVNVGKFLNEVMGITETISYAQQAGLTVLSTPRELIIYYGFFLFMLIFGLLLIAKSYKDKNHEKIEDVSFTLFFMFCGFYGFVSLYIAQILIYPDRLLTFAWLFAVIPITGILNTLKNEKFRRLFIMFLLVFMIFNVYSIQPVYLNKEYGSIDSIADYKEYAIANTILFDSKQKNYYGYSGVISAIYDIQGINSKNLALPLSESKKIENSSNIAIINENIYFNLEREDINTILSYKNSNKVNQIIDLGDGEYVLKGNS